MLAALPDHEEMVRPSSLSTRFAWLLVALAWVGPLAGCSPIVEPWRGVATLDSRASSGSVRLDWFTSTEGGSFDLDSWPDGPPIAGVLVERSLEGATAGWTTVKVTRRAGADSASFSGLADGRPVWFRVRALDLAGRVLVTSTTVMTVPGAESLPSRSVPVIIRGDFAWSPDGRTLAAVEQVGESTTLSLIDAITFARRAVSTSSWPATDQDASWSPDGLTLLITHTSSGYAGAIDYRATTVDVATGVARAVSPGRVDFDAVWEDSTHIVLCRGKFEPPNVPEVYRIDLAPGGAVSALTSGGRVHHYHPSVRRSDGLIVCEGRAVSARIETAGLYALSRTGGESRITRGEWEYDRDPAWASDGSRVVFTSRRCGHDEVWTYDLATAGYQQLTRGPRGTRRGCARLSPDGRWLAVLTGPGAAVGNGTLEFFELSTPTP